MSISYPLTFPTHTNVRSIDLRAVNAVAMSMSPFTYKQQVFAHQGQRWEADVTLPPMKRSDAEQWVAWLVSLKGLRGTFLMGDPVGCTARGSVGGTPLVNGASQTGDTLNIDGCTASQTPWIKAGDYIQLGSASSASLHKVLADANSDGSGEVALDIWPNINVAQADNATIVTSNAKGVWRLANNESNWSINEIAVYGLTFGCTQAIV
mgnify:FL=1